MVHARLGIAAENSGKLVSIVRREARRIAEEQNRPLILVDGPPGIGCPVIASVTGASLVLVVTEPTVSGKHDLERVLSLSRHFKIPALICVNKWDINPDMTAQIEQKALQGGARIVGRIPWDRSVTAAQIAQCSVVEYSESPATQSIKEIWRNTLAEL
jgi:MinD superfamily P-loop ATPase